MKTPQTEEEIRLAVFYATLGSMLAYNHGKSIKADVAVAATIAEKTAAHIVSLNKPE